MKNRVPALLATMALSACGLLGADFWRTKKYTEWDEADIAKLLSNSPWAQTFKVYLKGLTDRAGDGGVVASDNGGFISAPAAAAGQGGIGGWGGGIRGSDRVSAGIPITMRWHTALPIRQANAGLKFRTEDGASREAAESLGRPQPSYVVGISRVPVGAITVSPDELKSQAALRIRNSAPIHPLEVQVERHGATTVLYLVFPRLQEGARQIVAADDEVEVSLQLKAGKISRKFKLREMLFDGRLEL